MLIPSLQTRKLGSRAGRHAYLAWAVARTDVCAEDAAISQSRKSGDSELAASTWHASSTGPGTFRAWPHALPYVRLMLLLHPRNMRKPRLRGVTWLQMGLQSLYIVSASRRCPIPRRVELALLSCQSLPAAPGHQG